MTNINDAFTNDEQFTPADIEKLRQFPLIDQALVDSFLKHLKESHVHLERWYAHLATNPSEEQKHEWLLNNASKTSMDEMEKEVKFLQYIAANKDKIIQWLENEGKNNTFRKAGHLIDQQLKYPKPESEQLDLFSLINNSDLRSSLQQEGLIREN